MRKDADRVKNQDKSINKGIKTIIVDFKTFNNKKLNEIRVSESKYSHSLINYIINNKEKTITFYNINKIDDFDEYINNIIDDFVEKLDNDDNDDIDLSKISRKYAEDKIIYEIESENYNKDVKYIKDFFNNLGFSEIDKSPSENISDKKLYFGNFEKDGNSYSFYTSSKRNYVTEDDYVKIGRKLEKIKNKNKNISLFKLFINSAENFHIVTFIDNSINIEQFKKLIESLGFTYITKFAS